MTPRGIRNNNPGNLRRSTTAWLGQAKAQTDPDFVVFEAAEYGLRALARTLLSYQQAHGLKTLREIIGRFAPPSENDTGAYVAEAAARLGVAPDAPVDLADPTRMTALIEAVVRHENGVQPYPPAVLAAGLKLAGLETA